MNLHATPTLRTDGFYSCTDASGNPLTKTYLKTEDGKLFFFNSEGIGVEVVYRALSEHVIQIYDNLVDSCFLVLGEERTAVIDGMNGTVDLSVLARQFSEKPLVAIATHGHGDHIGGLQNFEDVYVGEADFDLFKAHSEGDLRYNFLSYDNYRAETGSTLDYTLVNTRENFLEKNDALRLLPLRDGQRFDLGGVSIECIAAPGHTPGSTAILVKEDRVLITGDAANRYTMIAGCPVEIFLKSLRKLQARAGEYDAIYASHAVLRGKTNTSHLSDTVIDELIEGCEGVLAGSIEGVPPAPGTPVRWAYEMGPAGRTDGKCGNFMFDPKVLRVSDLKGDI